MILCRSPDTPGRPASPQRVQRPVLAAAGRAALPGHRDLP
jgi:hypothetical protein